MMRLICLTAALVSFGFAAGLAYPAYEPWRLRLVAFGLALWVLAQYPFPS